MRTQKYTIICNLFANFQNNFQVWTILGHTKKNLHTSFAHKYDRQICYKKHRFEYYY